ncbi:Oligosaccharide 4-alpha-D-glucosyltransferase [Paenibacillus auburnensis]|uniref:Oligosaccharide 4-alpha-D-glucosyltransferase n=1 Tax=Paenibacillus auburnensis TaxID=2905649 RepID=A0ABM9CIV4_9BACL|nr:TIM-barrel domain-containing protein [Paenibacillus auburnensis]CAH1214091.1 Oligosaccharide 4-alpha-D-glucosyltransferase [Paenibacillus auburnensis]
MESSEAIRPEKMGPLVMTETWNTPGRIVSWERSENIYIVRGECGGMVFVFLSDDMFRMKVFRGEVPDLTTTEAVLAERCIPHLFPVEETEEQLIFTTGVITVVIEKTTFLLRVENRDGKVIMQQNMTSWNPRGASHAEYDMQPDSHFYGLGEKSSFLDKRGEHYTNWNTDVFAPHLPEIEALYESIPLIIHMHGELTYGLFLDNTGRSDFDMRSHGVAFTIGCSTGAYDIYFINGPEMKDVVKRYTTLTGRIALPPKWAIGYHQSRYSYMNQQEVLQLARTFRDKNIPCDVIYLDIHYMDEYRVFTFDPVNFPEPEKMIAELGEIGVRIVPIVDPGVKKDPKYEVYKEGVLNKHFCRRLEGDIFFGEVWPGISAFPDFSDSRTAEWWGDLHKYYTDLGIQGIWNDMNEPAVFNESKTMDLDVMHFNNGRPVTHEEYHNLYGMMMSKATYEGLVEHMAGERPFVLTRAGYAGIQRYAAVWTGDNRSFWEHMAMAIPMVLNMGLSGLAFAGPDIGGFAHHTSAQLLVRWTQMGVFFPYCRNHSSIGTLRQEPWSFGEEVEGILREFIGLRYRWMPHIYNLFREAEISGLPVIRPLILEYPRDPRVTNLCDQFLLGENVLIAPVYRPDTDHRSVYLPEGCWLDYWDGEIHEGGRHILAAAPLHIMPMYVKAGTFVAEGPLKQYALEEVQETVTFHLYGAEQGEEFSALFNLYEDDGHSFGYRRGEYSQLIVQAEGTGDGLLLNWSYTADAYKPVREMLRFALCYPFFKADAVDGLPEISLEELEQGRKGWTRNGKNGAIIIQTPDERSGGGLRIRAAE